MNKGVRDEEES